LLPASELLPASDMAATTIFVSLLHELLQCKPSSLATKRLPVEIRMN
jgi:hypothetical protein